jgi:hypothetical protein
MGFLLVYVCVLTMRRFLDLSASGLGHPEGSSRYALTRVAVQLDALRGDGNFRSTRQIQNFSLTFPRCYSTRGCNPTLLKSLIAWFLVNWQNDNNPLNLVPSGPIFVANKKSGYLVSRLWTYHVSFACVNRGVITVRRTRRILPWQDAKVSCRQI